MSCMNVHTCTSERVKKVVILLKAIVYPVRYGMYQCCTVVLYTYTNTKIHYM